MFISKLLILVLLFTFIPAETSWQHRSCADLQMGQFKCTQPVIDDLKQNEINCTADNLVKVSCYPAENVTCNRKRFDGKTIGFYKSVKCRYVTNYYYQTAVLLSIFFGIFGIDRFYLGYIAIGLLNLVIKFSQYFIFYVVKQISMCFAVSCFIHDFITEVVYSRA